ncbi:MAG: DUF3047 domain-containing protein [Desulfuromonadales bacterium]|nr:DUF3047 domain-containing protein [Desulfuromonadales bacterium]NIR33815.1 DUF3047 domain-containing protein [Desulfuromonadales bacterium]NIS41404.1 DUF3047 domain-containing protein [Desulfuromonadales bacterium]
MRFAWLPVLLCWALPAWGGHSILIDDFEQGLDPAWEEKVFEGTTAYSVVNEDGDSVLCAESNGSASGLVLKKEIDLGETPFLSWRWRIDGIVEKGNARMKEGDDYAARVYVIFPHWAIWKTRSLNYIWANRLPEGEMIPNSFTGNAMMIAVGSGPERAGEWVEERRNVHDDFKKAFGEDPPPVGAVAVMTDTDNTGSSAAACYDDIRFSAGTPKASEPVPDDRLDQVPAGGS